MIFAQKCIKYFLILIFFIKFSESRPEQCKSDSDCKNLDSNAFCSSLNSCKCPANKVISEYGDKCIPVSLFGEKCTENVQCSGAVKRSGCVKGVCQCAFDNERYLRGYCRELKDIAAACNVAEDCNFGYDRESVTCDSEKKVCSCANGYYLRSKNICRKITAVGGVCLVDTDCNGDSVKCIDSVCGGKKSIKNINISNKIDISPSSRIFLKNITANSFKFGDQCTKNLEPCDNLDNSICLENLCYCQLGYYLKNNKCMTELGERAKSKEFCSNNFDEKTSICRCKDNFFYESDLRTCKKSIKVTAGCTSDSQCSPYGAKCIEIDRKKKCICQPHAEFNEEKQICVDKTGYGAPCNENQPCKLQNSICNLKNLCECQNNYYLNNGECIAGIGAKCVNDEDCTVEKSVCAAAKNTTDKPIQLTESPLNQICTCQNRFVEFNNTCIAIAKNILDNCTHTKQCEEIGGLCIDKKCECQENEHFRFGRCEIKRHLGEQCSKAGQCYSSKTFNGIECRNSKCQCKLDYNTKDGSCFKTNSSNILRTSFLLSLALIFLLL